VIPVAGGLPTAVVPPQEGQSQVARLANVPSDITVLITVLGWLALLKGIAFIVWPQGVQRVSDRVMTDGGSTIFPYAALCLGLLFAYFGFVSAAPPNKSLNSTAAR
jgi:hypothetical protein